MKHWLYREGAMGEHYSSMHLTGNLKLLRRLEFPSLSTQVSARISPLRIDTSFGKNIFDDRNHIHVRAAKISFGLVWYTPLSTF